MTRAEIHARPGQPWPVGSWCPREVDEHGQSWVNGPRCTCPECDKTWALASHVPKRIPAKCPKCGAPVETMSEALVRANFSSAESEAA